MKKSKNVLQNKCDLPGAAIDRRDFLKSGLLYSSAILGLQTIPFFANVAHAAPRKSPRRAQDDHLFVQIQIEGSADLICSLDPKIGMPGLTDKQFYREYFDSDIRGGAIKMGPAGYPLLPFLDDLVVINGINMENQNSSHEGCRTYCASGAQGLKQFSSAVVEVAANAARGPFGVVLNTGSWFINKRVNVSQSLTESMGQSQIDANDSRFLLAPLAVTGDPFEDSLNAYINSVNAVHEYNAKLTFITQEMSSPDTLVEFELRLAAALASGLSHQGFLNFGGDYLSKILPGYADLDSHSNYKVVHQASQQKYWARLARTFEAFKKIEYKNSGKSVFEMTTFLVTNEFSKTPGMVEEGKDHNLLNNSMIIAGRGIKGNQTIGRSRYFGVNEWPGASRSQMAGMPIDFNTGAIVSDSDMKKLDDLMTTNANIRMLKPQNVIATVLDVLNIPQSNFKNFASPNVRVIPGIRRSK